MVPLMYEKCSPELLDRLFQALKLDVYRKLHSVTLVVSRQSKRRLVSQ